MTLFLSNNKPSFSLALCVFSLSFVASFVVIIMVVGVAGGGGGPGLSTTMTGDRSLPKELTNALAKLIALCQMKISLKQREVKDSPSHRLYEWVASLSYDQRLRVLAITDPTILQLLITMSKTCDDHRDRPRLGHRLRPLPQPTFLVFEEALDRPLPTHHQPPAARQRGGNR